MQSGADALPPVARNTDPLTSHIAARMIRSKRPSQMLRLLVAYVQGALTDEQAAAAVGVSHHSATKRCADLRNAGLIEPTGEVVQGSAGVPVRLCRLTDDGRRVLITYRDSRRRGDGGD